MVKKEQIIEYLRENPVFCANFEEKKALITFLKEKDIPMNPIILKYIFEIGEAVWTKYYMSGFQLEANCRADNVITFAQFIKDIKGLKKIKEPKWKKIWKDL